MRDPNALSSAEQTGFARFLGDRIQSRSADLTHRWLELLTDQIQVEARDVFPSEDLLNHVPGVLKRLGAFVADSGETLLEALVIEDLSRLAELRRRQGYGVRELLREYQVLSDILQAEAEGAAREYTGSSALVDVVGTMGRLKDATHLLGIVTARSFRIWRGRYEREREDLLATYGRVLGHELGNRLGAAETAVRLLQSDIEIEPERVDRLLKLALASIEQGLRTVDDVALLAKPIDLSGADVSIGLPLLVTESIRLARIEADEAGISVQVEGTLPQVRVVGTAVRIALSNLLDNAVTYHRSAQDERWVKVRCALDGEDVLIHVEDNGPGIRPEDRERIFDHYVRGNAEEDGSGLGLAITREALERVGGSIRLEEGGDGALFAVRVSVAKDQ